MKTLLALAAVVVVAGCAGEPTMQTGPNAETTFDGLVRIDNARFAAAWIDPDIDLTQYTKIIPGGAVFEFRNVQKTSATAARYSNEREFWISDKNKQRLAELVSEVFTEELQKSEHFTVTDEPAADTLIVQGALHDIVSRVPPEDVGRASHHEGAQEGQRWESAKDMSISVRMAASAGFCRGLYAGKNRQFRSFAAGYASV